MANSERAPLAQTPEVYLSESGGRSLEIRGCEPGRVYKPNQKGESIILLILPMTRKPKVLLKIPMMEPKILRIEPKILLKISMMEPKILLKILMMEITNLAQVSSDRTDILFYTSNE